MVFMAAQSRNRPAWDPEFSRHLPPLFAPLAPWQRGWEQQLEWPSLAVLQQWVAEQQPPVVTAAGAPLRVVAQAGRPEDYHHRYESRIHHRGELQTRSENWHDLFQLLSWFRFPQAKAVITELHATEAAQRYQQGADPSRRTALENGLTLLDEGGAVVVSDEPDLLELIRQFQWHELFWRRRGECLDRLWCIGFGHALWEKGLTPYIGLTAHALLLEVPASFFTLAAEERYRWLDSELAVQLRHGVITEPRSLQPLPILGLPDWDAANRIESYYFNDRYFRQGRQFRATKSGDNRLHQPHSP